MRMSNACLQCPRLPVSSGAWYEPHPGAVVFHGGPDMLALSLRQGMARMEALPGQMADLLIKAPSCMLAVVPVVPGNGPTQEQTVLKQVTPKHAAHTGCSLCSNPPVSFLCPCLLFCVVFLLLSAAEYLLSLAGRPVAACTTWSACCILACQTSVAAGPAKPTTLTNYPSRELIVQASQPLWQGPDGSGLMTLRQRQGSSSRQGQPEPRSAPP